MSAPPPNLAVLVVGVGGQGTLTAARVLGEAAMAEGLPVRLGQLHGMSQRGGSVESTVLIGPGRSAFLPRRGADVILGLEPLELLRARPKMHAGTRVLASRSCVVPTPMALQGVDYPDVDGLFEQVRALVAELVVVDGSAIADRAMAGPALNAAMLGVLCAQSWLPFDDRAVLGQLERRSPAKHLESNRRAFAAGQEATPS